MRNSLVTIPIDEVFQPREGCPLCRLRDTLEARTVEYITGAAMMEPDIRIQTNKEGFCHRHYRQMLARRNRLSVALMLESHLDELDKQVFSGLPLIGKSGAKQGVSAGKAAESCFICHQVDDTMRKMLATVCRTWEEQKAFRDLFREQEGLCLPHFAALAETAEQMSKKSRDDFVKAASELCRGALTALRQDVSHFCKMFDYRNSGEDADWGNSKDAIERAVRFLTTRELP
ncbi:MAG: DUF6062 family protein [Acutalibacteraceae bacterium]|jgi:hypothetical protein